MDNTLVAHYDLEKEYTERMYEASGHNLMVFEDYAQLAIGEYTLSFFFFSLKFLLTQFYSHRNHCVVPHNAPHKALQSIDITECQYC